MHRQTSWQHLVLVVGVALLVAVMSSRSHDVWADPKGFVFTPLVFLGDPTPGGDTFLDAFDSSRINNRGDVLFGSNVTADEEEGLFLLHKGDITEIARAREAAPGGGVYDFGFLAPTSLNDRGEVGFAWLLEPFCFPDPSDPSNACPPIGVNTGVYRFSQSTHTATPVVRPGVTPVPGGEVFAGAHFGVNLNDRGDLAFAGIVPTDHGIHLPDEAYIGLGARLFKANKKGEISSIIGPGDPAPGGGVFDWAIMPWINDGGDVAFMGHVAGEECRAEGSPPQAILILCLSSIYVKQAGTGNTKSIAHAGDPAPDGGLYRQAMSPVVNNRGDIVFLGDLTPPPASGLVTGVYLHSGGETIAVARPGDPMPGGGRFVTASLIQGWQLHVNYAGEVVFNAALDTDNNEDDIPDTGLYAWSHGSLRVVARTGTVIPGVGTIAHLSMNVGTVGGPSMFVPNSGANNNDRGQVVFGATLDDNRGVLLVATPK
jgi:hypothetical protein